jgi:hypothetical protein
MHTELIALIAYLTAAFIETVNELRQEGESFW